MPATDMKDLPRCPLLSGLYHIVSLDEDRVQIANANRSVVLSGSSFARRVSPLLHALEGKSEVSDLEARFGDIVRPVLHALLAKGLLTDGSGEADSAWSAPQRAAEGLAVRCSPGEAVRRLTKATVLVAGCGPVGGMVAVLLAKAGAGRLILVDNAEVSAVDVAVSPVLAPRDENRPRAEVSAERCAALTRAAVETHVLPVGREVVCGGDLAVIELDHGERQAHSVGPELCLSAGLPHLCYSQDGLQATIGPLVGSQGKPCRRCLDIRRKSFIAHLPEHEAYLRHRELVSPHPDSYLSAHTSLLAGLICTESLRALMGEVPAMSSGILFVDLGAMTFTPETLLSVPGCPACSAAGSQRNDCHE